MHSPSWMNAELETLRDSVRRFCETELLPHGVPAQVRLTIA